MNKQQENKLRKILKEIFVNGQDQYSIIKIVKEEYLK